MAIRHLKKISKIVTFLAIVFFGFKAFAFFGPEKAPLDFESTAKKITINDNGLVFELLTEQTTITETLAENNIKVSEHDEIHPEMSSTVFPGAYIEIRRAAKILVEVDGKKIEKNTLEKNVRDAIRDSGITLGRLDRTEPDPYSVVQNNMKIVVTRINVEEVTIPEPIDFKTTIKNDSKLGWREKKIETRGEKGIREVTYKITYKNGKEISRVTLSKTVAKEPITQVEVQGTYIKVGKANKGQGTWYSYQGGMYAASLTIPKGGYARVTNTANGKSVIVEINDSGPYGKGRIIDLDKPAFQKIAELGAGVVNVKVEEVLN